MSGQVIAQGIAKLPRGELAWTVRRLDVPGGDGIAVDSFPIGFALADSGAVAIRDEGGDVLSILDDGEAAFLPDGKKGALTSWRGETAALYEIALLPAEVAATGETSGSVAGAPFAAPTGGGFEIELARETVSADQQVPVPVSRSGAPVLFLLTDGTARLATADGQAADLAAGQFALLGGEVLVGSADGTPATFVVAAIGDATGGAAAAEETRAPRAGRANRERAAGGAVSSGGEQPQEKRARRVRTGGGGGRGGQQAPTAPVTGGGAATPPPGEGAGTPPPVLEPTSSATIPPDQTIPTDGTPPPDLTLPTDLTPTVETIVPVEETPNVETVTPEATIPAETVPTTEPVEGESVAPVETPVPEATLPVEEAPAEQAPVEEAPAEPAQPTEAPPEG